ncbi:Zn-dependent hydrolase [Devosia sp. ZB163]|uniref:Zn-dependent hydrolase n=1 Tax=Devosia sp. ZB163 TaxID=3025938 RepID=UPI00235FFDF5|nr:Zn-dependent hydrolase [Devosia sp. ZB163]MDC9823708.1 Zn-dependent hydrolase [Devosia sp. ZB163]
MTRNLPTQEARIAEDITSLAEITDPDRPFTRRAFTPIFLKGREWLRRRFEAAGLETRIDASGNLIGTRPGKSPGRGTIMLGSHSDTVPDGGRFDGIAGVSAALEVARALRDQKVELEHDLEIVDFLAEEVSIFGVSCVGSRGMAGVRPTEWLEREAEGLALRDGIREVGGHPGVTEIRNDIKAFLELHIEQGPVLEDGGLDVGVVTAIAGITRIEVVVDGRADHAGTTPMGSRQDALTAAARLVLGIEMLGTELAGGDFHFAATVGEFSIEPGAANVVPSRARLLIDARAERREDMETFVAELAALVEGVSAETGVAIEPPLTISDNLPTPCDPFVLDTLDAAAVAVGARHRRMASGAGHDTAWMARVTKAAMIFIPCLGGRSHTPEEYAETADVALGAAVLLEAVKRLDREL